MTNLKLNTNTIELTGSITFENIVNMLEICISKTKTMKNIVIDLKDLQDPNSCTLIFMINCIRYAMKNQQKIKFINIPLLLIELSKVYNLNKIINNG